MVEPTEGWFKTTPCCFHQQNSCLNWGSIGSYDLIIPWPIWDGPLHLAKCLGNIHPHAWQYLFSVKHMRKSSSVMVTCPRSGTTKKWTVNDNKWTWRDKSYSYGKWRELINIMASKIKFILKIKWVGGKFHGIWLLCNLNMMQKYKGAICKRLVFRCF